jgi:hypothetical protein
VASIMGKIDKANIQLEILKFKKILYLQAKYYNFDLQHPEIQSVSRRLEKLIVIVMKENGTH